MNLEEFRKYLESYAIANSNKMLETKIKELRREQENSLQDHNGLMDDCRALASRCFALTQGYACWFCQLNTFTCEHAIPFDKKLAIAEEFRKLHIGGTISD